MLTIPIHNLYLSLSIAVFGVICGFVIRWKWNKAIERERHVMRLAAMASEEAARAELEAAAQYSYYYGGGSAAASAVVSDSHECAVCYSPTTTRCSRCKAVHYCSGKCQIIHWRLGHKDKCYPPNNTFQMNGPESKTDQKAVSQGDQDEVFVNLEVKESRKAKSIETYSEEPSQSSSSYTDDNEVGKTPVISDSFSTLSLLGSSVATSNGPLPATSVSELPVLSDPDTIEGPLCNGITQEGPDTKADVNHTKLAKSPPLEDSTLDDSIDSISHCESISSSSSGIDGLDDSKFSKLSIPPSDFWERALESHGDGNSIDNGNQSGFTEGGEEITGNKSPSLYSKNLSQRDVPLSRSQFSRPKSPLSDEVNPTVPAVKSSPKTRPEKPASVDNISSDSKILERRQARSLSSSSSGNNTNSNSVGQPVSSVMSSSVRKVVQQFKVFKPIKHYATGFGCEEAEKSNYKVYFQYELFIKLYHWDEVELRPCGLTNIGNSCYANAVLQCLAFTRPLTAYLLQGFHSKTCAKKEWCFMCEFGDLILKAKDAKSPLSPSGLLSQLQSTGSHLGNGREEDAHEFLRHVIDTLQFVCLKEARETVVDRFSEETTLIGLIFGGFLRSKIQCMKCLGKSERHERMMDLTVEIHGNIGTLEEALKQFTATETLDGENKYNCLRCGSKERAKKKLTILEAPNVLTIALKRFQSGEFGKLKKRVQFPEYLDLVPYMSDASDRSPIYRLYAVAVHRDSKNATFSGHYVCYVRTIHGKWFSVDDSIVNLVELEKVLSEEAYMLFYSRRSPWAPRSIRKTISSNYGKSKDKNRSTRPRYAEQGRGEEYRYSTTNLDGAAGFEPFDLFGRPTHGIPRVDSSLTDSSSLFSNSDEGSCSTESTRDSASADDSSDYWNSPQRRVIEISDTFRVSEGHVSSFLETSKQPSHVLDSIFNRSGVSPSQSQVGSNILHSNDTSKHCTHFSNSISHNSSNSCSRDADLERLGYNSSDVNSGVVSQRRNIRERTAQTFY